MLRFVLDLAHSLHPEKTVAVLGHKQEQVKKIIPAWVKIVPQEKLLGTGDAVKKALAALAGFKGSVLILYGDIPLLKKESIDKLLKFHIQNQIDATILSAKLNKPAGYGRVLRDKYCAVRAIVEDADANAAEKDIKEINTGIICFNKEKLSGVLNRLKANNRKKEYYLTDIVGIFYKKGLLVDAIKIGDAKEALGINSRADLSRANAVMQERINCRLMDSGVTIVAPEHTFISYGTKIGRDTIIYPFTVIEPNVRIGKHCLIGPFAHLRENTVLEDDVTAGNFIETVRSKIGAKSFAKHLCYIGDTRVGKSVNIGAGSVTANFDGKKKNITRIEGGAFIGSNTVMVAPLKIGKKAITGAGSAVTKNVADKQIVVGVPARPLVKK